MRLLKFNLRAYFNRASFEPIRKPLEYTVTAPAPTITKDTLYLVLTVGSASKDLTYEVTHLITEGLDYAIITTSEAETKSITYAVRYTPTPIEKDLAYLVTTHITLENIFVYSVRSTHTPVSKSLVYRVYYTPEVEDKSLDYCVQATVSISKTLVYDVCPVITKTMTYHVHINVLNLIQPKFRLRDMRVLAAGGHKIQSFRNIYKR
jgi:uncharacterized lipoprotein YbaY